MAVKFNCSKCKQDVVFKYLKAEDTGKCPHCGKDVVIPADAIDVGDNFELPMVKPSSPVPTANPPQETITEPVTKSVFVTVLAWIFIIFSGLGTLWSVFMIFATSSMPTRVITTYPQSEESFRNIIIMFRYLSIGAFVFTVTALVTSIELLGRKNWARSLFIAFMVIGILLNFFMIIAMFASFRPSSAESAGVFIAMFNALIQVGFSVIFIWIIKKLSSDEIKREFH
ncbi:MAG: hypothetical protein WC980_05615 [Candidatus Brocadiia bacterium]